MEYGIGNTVSIWLCFTCTIASMCCGLGLAVCCARLRAKHPKEIFVYLLMWIGIADVLHAVWNGLMDIAALRGKTFFDCIVYIFVQRFLIMLTTLDALVLALGMILQLHGTQRHVPRALWWAPWLAIPTAMAMESVYILRRESTLEDWNFLEVCISNGIGTYVYISEVASIMVITVILHIVVIGHAWRTAPRSVARRSVASASRYFLAFFMTHVLTLSYKIWWWMDPAALGGCRFESLRVVANICLDSNGLFNFLAFWIHARRVARSQKSNTNAHVNFHGTASLQEELEIPYGESARKGPGIRRQSTGAEDWLQDELGSCLGDLYPDTPLTEAEMPDCNGIVSISGSDGFIDA